MTWNINCDMGEAYGLYTMGDDEAIMPYITVANVACGFHAADPMVMRRTVQLARRFGVKVGAHPSLPDREGFGRREMKMRPEEITNAVIYQVGALKGFLEAEGVSLNHIKPHGALYGMAAQDAAVAGAIAEAAAVFGVPLYGLCGTQHEAVYPRGRTPFVGEFYADLDYGADGFLIITREHAAVDPGAAAQRVLRALQEGKVKTLAGTDVPVRAQSVCVHSDTPGSVAVARAVFEILQSARATD
jgi:5-oxoprolinase (ATP-hydrolysing) subunit A